MIRFADGETCSFEYDKAGRMMAQEDVCGRTEYGYNARNRRALVRDGEGNETRWMYDGMGRCLRFICQRRGRNSTGNTAIPMTSLTASSTRKIPDGGHERLVRDGEGNVLKRVHPNAYDSCRDDGREPPMTMTAMGTTSVSITRTGDASASSMTARATGSAM